MSIFDEPIPLDAQALFHQASMTTSDRLIHAHETIDRRFGDGCAAKHPELVAAFIQCATTDFGIAITNKIIGNTLQGIAISLAEIAETINRQSR